MRFYKMVGFDARRMTNGERIERTYEIIENRIRTLAERQEKTTAEGSKESAELSDRIGILCDWLDRLDRMAGDLARDRTEAKDERHADEYARGVAGHDADFDVAFAEWVDAIEHDPSFWYA